MKAIVKRTGEVIQVTKAGEAVSDTGGIMIKWYCAINDTIYDTEELVLCDVIDWEQRKYEVAKAILPTLLLSKAGYDPIKWAVRLAEKFIKKLKRNEEINDNSNT